jgi:phosphate uptake regulator
MLLISLVKDAERIGDYAKDLIALRRQCPTLPAHSSVEGLRTLSQLVETHLRLASDAFALSERQTAESVLHDGQETIQKLDEVVDELASSDLDPRSVAALALAAHYYKRICSHSLNIVSSVVQPLHRLDYYSPKHDAGTQQANPAAS